MQVFGLTGGIGSGKSTVAEMIERFGVPVISADELSRMVVAPGTVGLAEVTEAFGEDVLGEGGKLDRGKLAKVVFSNPAKRKQLESILHPLIRERFLEVKEVLEQAGHTQLVYEIPLLFENNLEHTVDGVIVVTASEPIRIERVIARSNLRPSEVRRRIDAQIDENTRRNKADYLIVNDGDRVDLQEAVEAMLREYLLPLKHNDGHQEL